MGPLTKLTRLLFAALALLLMLFVFVYDLSSHSIRESRWLAMSRDLQTDILEANHHLARLRVEKGDHRELLKAIERCREIVVTLLRGGPYGEERLEPVDEAAIRARLTQLVARIQAWQDASSQLTGDREEAPMRSLQQLAEATTGTAAEIDKMLVQEIEERGTVKRRAVIVAIAGLGLILLITFAVTRRAAKVIAASEQDASSALRTLDVQRRAFDHHSIVAITDASGIIIHVNDKFCQISGYSSDELLGQDHRILNSGYHPPEFFQQMWRTISGGNVWHGEILNRTKDGELYWVDTTIVPHLNEKGQPQQYVAIRTDITQRKRYEAALKEAEGRLRRHNRTLRDLAMRDHSATLSLAEVAYFYTERVALTLGVARVGIWLFASGSTACTSIGRYDLRQRRHDIAPLFTMAESSEFKQRLQGERLILASTAGELGRLHELSENYFKPQGVAAAIVLGVRAGTETIGFIAIEEFDGGREWELDEQNFASSVADLLSGVVQTITRNRVEGALRIIAQTAPAAGTIFEELARQIAKGLGVNYVAIGRVTGSGGAVRTLGVWDERGIVPNFSYPLRQPLGPEVVLRDVDRGGNEIELPHSGEYPHYLAAPILGNDSRAIGVITVMSRTPLQGVEMATAMLRLCAVRAAAELERSTVAERLKSIVEGMSDFIWETDREGRVLYCSERVKGILGYTPEEIAGRHFSQFISDEEEDYSGQHFSQLMGEGKSIRNFELWIRTRSNKRVCLLCNATPVHDEEGHFCGYRGINSDITERKESELRSRMLATAIDQSVDGVVIADVLGYIEYVNPAYLRIIGRSAEEVIGCHLREEGLITTEQEFREEFLKRFGAGQPWSGRCSNQKRSGRSFDEEVILTPIQNQQNSITKVVIGVRDISHELQLEQQLRQSQKMQAIGTMAGGIAHDFNNILSAILGYSDLTLEELPEGSPSHENLVQVVQAANRARNLVQQILAFSRQSASSLQLLSPRTMTREVMKLLRTTIPVMIEIREEFDIGELFVRMDPTQYHQVVMNLVVNAAQAIGDQPGTIALSLTETVLTTHEREVPPGHYAVLSVEDSGCGMSAEVQERIFEPFFTTKAVDEGTGMGLAVVHGIISAIDGHIRVSSVPGKGSRFDIYMPVASTQPQPEVDEEEVIRRGQERILMVDDEPVQTALMQQMLTRLGYQVTCCTSSREALKLLASDPGRFDAVITDQNMPGLTGEQLCREVLRIRPGLPIMMCTGYSQSFGPAEAEALGIREYVMKPIALKELARALDRVFAPNHAFGEGSS